MKFEKISEDKVRITLNTDDLKAKNIDLHNFMASPIESQSLFLDMLELAEQKVGFTTKNYKIAIEALAVSTGDFIFTLTRTQEHLPKKVKINMKRKTFTLSGNSMVYCFSTFEDFIQFCLSIENSSIKNLNETFKNIKLYEFKDNYYLLLKNLNTNKELLQTFCTAIIEFAQYIHNPELFASSLQEHGKVIIKSDAINTCIKHFVV